MIAVETQEGPPVARREVTRVVVRVLGLLTLANTAVSLPVAIYGFRFLLNDSMARGVVHDLPSLEIAIVRQFYPFALWAALGVFFIWGSHRIVARASNCAQEAGSSSEASDLRTFEVSLVAVVGLYFLMDGFIALVHFVLEQFLVLRLSNFMSVWTFTDLVRIIMKLTVGAGLVLGRGAAVATLHKARYWVKKWRAWPYQIEDRTH